MSLKALNLKSVTDRLPFLGRPSSILVCETDGFHLRGAVISRDGNRLKIDLTARSEAIDYKTAVNELVNSLRSMGWKGQQTILLTPAVFSTLLELPVSPKQPRPVMQMQEMIRWELEPLLMQHNMLWSIGQLLLVLGYLNEAQVKEVLDRQQGKHKTGLGDGHGNIYSYKRFGELAMGMDFITQAQLDECLAKQAWLRSDSDEISCGWSSQVYPQAEGDEEAGEVGVHSWLVSGASVGMMRQWEAAFAASKVTLKQVYPLVGCASGLLEQAEDAILLESQHGFVSGMRLEQGAVAAIKLQHRDLTAALDGCLESYHGLIPPEAESIWIAAQDDAVDELAENLEVVLGRKIQLLAPAAGEASQGMLGAARDLFRMPGAGRSSAVSVRGPIPPIWQRPEARAVAAGVLLVLTIIALEATLYIRQGLAQGEHTRTAVAKKSFDAVVSEAQAKVDAVNKAKADVKAKEEELKNLNARFDFFALELPARMMFVQSLMDELENTVNEDVVINAVEETPSLGFRIAGWALSETAAQQFILAFKTVMLPRGFDVVDPIVRAQGGRLGLIGYDIHFRLAEIKSTPAAASLSLPAGSGAKR